MQRAWVWTGGAVFVASLAWCAYAYAFPWGAPDGAAGVDWRAIAVNTAAFTLFAAHHSLFARAHVKRWMARAVPERLNRSFYVWVASVLLAALVLLWRDTGGTLYRVDGWPGIALGLVQLTGVWLIARAVRAIDALDLAGIRPAVRRDTLQVSGPYYLVRHPLYLGWILIVFGAAHMTADRLTFAVLTASYLVVAIPWEERSLELAFGRDYREYRRLVRWRVIPFVY